MKNKMKKLITMVVALAMLTVMSTAVFAADPAPTATVTGGTLTIAALGIANFTAVTLDGTTQTTTAVVADTALTDSRGLGDGWQVSLKASRFILDEAHSTLLTGGTPGTDAVFDIDGTTVITPAVPAVLSTLGTMPVASIALGAVTIATVDVGSTAITNIANISTGNLDTTAGINILTAGVDEGMGTYTVSMLPMTLTLLPATTYAGTYTSTVTQTLTSGPVV